MADIAMIGDIDTALLAGAAGILACGVNDYNEAQREIIRLAREGTKVIFITEAIYSGCAEVIDKYKTQAYPAIIPIPDSHGSTGLAMAKIKENVEKAIGVDILFAEENK